MRETPEKIRKSKNDFDKRQKKQAEEKSSGK